MHSKLPFQYIETGEGKCLCDAEGKALNSQFDKLASNAAFIVHAVNSHEELVSLINDLYEYHKGEPISNILSNLVDRIAALAKANPQSSR